MNIVYIATDSYVSMLGISLFSLLENNKSMEQLSIYILSTDLSQTNQNVLRQVTNPYHRQLHFVQIGDYQSAFSADTDTSGFHPIVLARLLLTRYLPQEVHTVLYLDCDTIIHGSLDAMEPADFCRTDYAFAAVPEVYMPSAQKSFIGLAEKDIYYNCGVLLINMDYWRRQELCQNFVDYYTRMNGKLMYNDQDILNHCCQGHILTLSQTYNFAPVLYYFPYYFIRKYQPAYKVSSRTTYKEIIRHPSIIHYLGEERPWVHGNFSPYRKVYDSYKAQTPWKNTPMIYGKEKVLFCYHILNLITAIFPWFRRLFTKCIGIRYYQFTKKD
ncbi:glycosyltransferase family 8 protein [Blautia sp. 1033sp1_1033st1_G9_1033SCRN_220408]|uniref:glycosyltransferase family 8 protein n=1 Tax=Blautia sp. 1033sp1_1033st1_G9_1033SCRN_220408 TaxID=3144490 RepID=UPI0034A28C87